MPVYSEYIIIPTSATGCMLQGWCIAEMDFYSTDMVGLCYGRVKNKEKND